MPQPPQFLESFETSFSHPSAGLPLQSPQSPEHANPQPEPVQTGTAFVGAVQASPQAVQFAVVPSSTSQPSPGLLLQLACWASQTMPQVPPLEQVANPPLELQEFEQLPQVRGLVRDDSQPGEVVQFAKPGLQAHPHTPFEQVPLAFTSPGQGDVGPQRPALVQVRVPFPSHCLDPGTQAPEQAPFEQTKGQVCPGCHWPKASQDCTWLPEHWTVPGEHVPEQAPLEQTIGQV